MALRTGGNRNFARLVIHKRKLLTNPSPAGAADLSEKSLRSCVGYTNFRPIRKLLARGLLLGVNSASAHVQFPSGRRSLFLPFPAFRTTQEVARRRMRNVSAVIRAVSSTGVRRPQAPGIPVTWLPPPPRPSGVAGSRALSAPCRRLPSAARLSGRPRAASPRSPPPWRRRGLVLPGECGPPRGAGARAGLLANSISGPWEGRQSCKGPYGSPPV